MYTVYDILTRVTIQSVAQCKRAIAIVCSAYKVKFMSELQTHNYKSFINLFNNNFISLNYIKRNEMNVKKINARNRAKNEQYNNVEAD